jgi:dipeptidyl aminopeptidase/acylaminoacyl peptidase
MGTHRTVFKKEIVCEFAVPKKPSNKVIILCGGMPGHPSKKEIIEKFAQKGFWVFVPRYRGSWESFGKFLEKSPHKDILDVIDSVYKPIVDSWDKKKYSIKNPQIFVYGVSFGGPAALLVSKDKRVRKVIAMSPVVDWRVDFPDEPMDQLGVFLKQGFGRAYDYEMKDWIKLSNGELYNPITEIEKIDGKKVWILHAKDDSVVPFGPSEELAKIINCKLTLFKKGNHGLGKILFDKRRYFNKLIKWFK